MTRRNLNITFLVAATLVGTLLATRGLWRRVVPVPLDLSPPVSVSVPPPPPVSATGDETVEIVGSGKFKGQAAKALELLRDKAPGAYRITTEYVKRIEQAERSGMAARETPPTYRMADKTAFYSVTWCASTIAHDALHSKLYHDYKREHGGSVPARVWTGVEAEKKCIAHQLAVLQKIGAPFHEVSHCRKQKGTHHDVNKDGKYDSKDYKKRDW